MSKKKKIILSVLLTTAAIVGITTGVVFAEDENEDVAQPEARQEALFENVCDIYQGEWGVQIDPEKLQDAFAEAQGEMMEEAMNNRLDKLVEEGVISQEEADQLKEWLEARPDVALPGGPRLGSGFGGRGCGGRFGPRLGGPGFPGGQWSPSDTTETSFAY